MLFIYRKNFGSSVLFESVHVIKYKIIILDILGNFQKNEKMQLYDALKILLFSFKQTVTRYFLILKHSK